MSLSSGGRGAPRSAAPDRRPIDRSSQPHPLFYRASASSLGSWRSSSDFEKDEKKRSGVS
jgi:hypothetical protein